MGENTKCNKLETKESETVALTAETDRDLKYFSDSCHEAAPVYFPYGSHSGQQCR